MAGETRLIAEQLAVIAYAVQEEIAPLVTKGEAAADIAEDYLAEIRDALAELTHDLRSIARDLLKLEETSSQPATNAISEEIRAALWKLVDDLNAAAEAVRTRARSSQAARSDQVLDASHSQQRARASDPDNQTPATEAQPD